MKQETKREIAECKKCGHIWLPREGTGRPRICPKCKSARWDVGPVERTPKKPETVGVTK